MLYDFTYMWNLKTKTKEHNKTKTVIDMENKQVVADSGVGVGKRGVTERELRTVSILGPPTLSWKGFGTFGF